MSDQSGDAPSRGAQLKEAMEQREREMAESAAVDGAESNRSEPASADAGSDDTGLADAAATSAAATSDAAPDGEATDPLVAVTAERDEYLDALQRLKAEFANHKRRSGEAATLQREQAAAGLVERLLPVLDACEAALGHGAEEVRPVADQLREVLVSQGLAVVDPAGEPFDPEHHDAVMHEPGDDVEVPTVADVLRTGYSWNGRTIRAAMVKVVG